MTLADRIAVMRDGKLIQVGRPLDIYQRPANLFVARFVGDVPINVLPRTVVRDRDSVVPTEADKVGFRSEHVDVSEHVNVESGESMSASQRFAVECEARVRDVERMGDHARVYLKPSFAGLGQRGEEEEGLADLIVARCGSETNLRRDDQVSVSVAGDHLLWFDRDGNRLVS
jgi:ABC-type sugar transport system ATPase subunit